jgi:hypothetical protein
MDHVKIFLFSSRQSQFDYITKVSVFSMDITKIYLDVAETFLKTVTRSKICAAICSPVLEVLWLYQQGSYHASYSCVYIYTNIPIYSYQSPTSILGFPVLKHFLCTMRITLPFWCLVFIYF